MHLCVCKGVKSSGKVSKMNTWEGREEEVFVVGVIIVYLPVYQKTLCVYCLLLLL